MGVSDRFREWPVYRQLKGRIAWAGAAPPSPGTRSGCVHGPTADHVTQSICPYCAVGCGQQVYVKDDKVVQIEGDPASPVSRGRLCPKGSATLQLTTGPAAATRSSTAPRTVPTGSPSTWRRPWTWSPTG